MKQRTLKEVAQAGLVLGFEWIAMDGDWLIYLYSQKPECGNLERFWFNGGEYSSVFIKITDFPNLPPEKSLLKLSEIVEGE